MVKRTGLSLISLSFGIFALLLLAACAGTPHNFHAVVLTPSAAQTIGQGKTLAITAQVLDDSAGGGVTWGLQPATGTLAPTTITSATYNAPGVVASATIVTVTATSIDFPAEMKQLQITVEPPPTITTTTLPSGSINGAYSATVNATGGVPPFVWSVSSGTLPPGLSLAASNTNSVMIVGTPDFAGHLWTIRHPDRRCGRQSRHVRAFDNSNQQSRHRHQLLRCPMAARAACTTLQFQATGGTGPYSWAVAAGSTLPAGLSLSSTGLLSGTPTAQGTTNFSVTVTDSEVPPASLTKSFSLTVAGTTGVALVNGPYAFEFSGFNAHGAVVAAGSFTADGAGNITAGVADFNSFQGPPSKSNQTFTGMYTVGNDNRGTAYVQYRISRDARLRLRD